MKSVRGYYDVFMRTCAKFPSRIAVRHYEDGVYTNYTYSELYGVCEYVSQNLLRLNCNRGVIGIVSERNILIPCIIAATHKCCTTFMFIDPSQDVESLACDISFTVMVTIKKKNSDEYRQLFKKGPDKTVTVFDLVINFYSCNINKQESQETRHLNQHSFIARTSGSTGDPKHIQVPIQCIQPNINDLTKMFNIIPDDIIYFSTPLTFDPSMVEILLAFMNGASLLIAPAKADILFPGNKRNSITVWQTTPSRFFQYSNADIKNRILSSGSTLKILALGGEPLNGIKRLKELKDCDNKTRIFTLYGVTEMSCWASAAELDLDKVILDREVPLGTCLSETEVIVEPSPTSSDTGNIILVSKTRKCYILNKPKGKHKERNSLRFVDTGDLGEITNGTIYYRGRKDDIIKRFGHKVNLQFIETTVMECPKVKTCSCVWLPKPMLLIVYFSSETLRCPELSDFLKCKLDDKHWPDKVVRVDTLPTSFHGKVSKQLLSKMYENIEATPQNLESLKTSFLNELNASLNRNYTFDEIKEKDFFSLGGTSFLAVSLCNKLSLICPQFSNLIQPYLLSSSYSIGSILEIVQKEMSIEKQDCIQLKKKIKRSNSNQQIEETLPSKKSSMGEYTGNPVEFVIAWTYDTAKCVDASPTIYQSGNGKLAVVVGSHSGRVLSLDASGARAGGAQLAARVESAALCAPAAEPCGVVGAHDGSVVCFTLQTDKELWRTNIGAMVKSKAVYCDGLVYVAAYDGCVRGLDILTGAIKSCIRFSEQGISADLALAKQQYIVAASLGGACGAVRAGAAAAAWRATLRSPVFAAPALYDADKYAVFAEVGGDVHCRTVEKGIKIWRYQGAKGNIFSSIHIKEVDNLKWQMFFGCFDNKVYSINVQNFQPSLNWKTHMTSPVYCTPCKLTDKLILAASNDGNLCVLDTDNGNIVAEYKLPNETFSSPVCFGDYIFIGCRDDNLYALKYTLNV